MNVAHEVLVSRRLQTLSIEPQTVDASALLRPSNLNVNSTGTSFEISPVEEDISPVQEMNPISEVQIQTSIEVTDYNQTVLRESGHRRKCSSEDGIHFVDDDEGLEFQLDARHLNRVHEELEKLNIATDVINKLELQLDHTREKFKQIHSEWSKRSDEIQKKYDSAIKKSRPYYEAVREEQRLRDLAQQATSRFEKANSLLQVAKQQVQLTQDSLARQQIIQPDCLEVLNHHVQRVNEAEQERLSAEEEHCQLSQQMIQCTQRVRQLAKDNSRSIKKAKHYFDLHKDFKKRLEHQKMLISKLETEVKQKKRDYTSSLRNLEQISDSIHEERSLTSTKHSARTPDSTRKSVSAVGLSKLHTSDPEIDDSESAVGDLDGRVKRSKRRTGSSLNSAAVDSHSTTSTSSSGGISMSMSQKDQSISDLCTEMPESLTFDDYFDMKIDASTSSSSHHGRSVSELSGFSDASSQKQRPMGTGVILLAQRLMNGSIDKKNESSSYKHDGRDESDDVCYHTAPQGISPIANNS